MAAACVVKRSLPAAIVGLAAVATVPLLAMTLPVTRATEWIDLCFNSWKPADLASVGALAFGLGSLFAFATRRADVWAVRRATSAIAGAALVLGPTFGATMRNVAWALDIERGSAHATISRVEPSRDGRFIAVEVLQEWAPRVEWLTLSGSNTGSRCRVRREVWILDRGTDKWNEIDDRYRVLVDSPAWDERGGLQTISLSGSFGEDPMVLERINPDTGGVTGEVTHDLGVSLGNWCSCTESEGGSVLTWKAKRIQLRLPKEAREKCARQPGVVFHEQDGYVVRHQLEPDCVTRLLAVGAVPGSTWIVTPDDSMLYDFRHRVLVDACDGHVVHAFDESSHFYGRSRTPGRIGWVLHGGDLFTILNDDGSETPLPIDSFWWQELGLDALLRADEHSIESMKLDGSERKVLYQASP
jgi:hypothetical protein